MQKLILAAAVLCLASCANTRRDAVGSPEAAHAPAKAECCPSTGTCTEGAPACSADQDAAVCPVTGKRATE